MDATQPRILTNMAFWQSETWMRATDSLYDLSARRDPALLPYWREAWRLFGRRHDYDVIVTMGVRESMCYGLLCLLTGRPSRQVMTEVFIDAPRPLNLLWHVKNACYRWVARRAIGLLTNSSSEVDSVARRYNLDRARIRYVPLNTNITDPAVAAEDGGFVLSAGRTLRDFDTLLRAAAAIEAPIVIIGGRADVSGLIPGNVEVLREVSREVYLDHLRRARVVALPLLATERATGQVVILEAMAFGKPVVTTRAPGAVDHIRDGENGFLVEAGDAEGLARRINELLHDAGLRRRLGEAAVRDMRESASAEYHAVLKLAAIRALWQQAQRARLAP